MSLLGTDERSRIRALDVSVVNKIAAGEVIERPASVVKEFLENSIDALSTCIEVEVEQGGAELIRISDDGEGIHPEDLELAVTAHATSKLHQADDLFQVRTLGFRGEALASIAEISKFRIRSRPAGQELGQELEVACGIVKEPRPCGCPQGTSIEVRELFLSTPVRRKFLKSAATEFSHIAEQFTRIALANPGLRLTLRHNGKLVYELPACDRLGDRLLAFFGSEFVEQMIWIEAERNGQRLWGYVGHPSLNKSTRKSQYLFLNGRYIQDRTLQAALTEAYRGLLMVGRQPVCFLFLELPPDQVDVNVHPTKAEVRFQDPQSLYRLILSTVRTKFLGMNLEPQLNPSGLKAEPAAQTPLLNFRESGLRGLPAAPAAAFRPTDVGSTSDRLPDAGASGVAHHGAADDVAAEQERVRQEFADWTRQQFDQYRPRSDVSDLEARIAADEAERRARGDDEAQPSPPAREVPPWAGAPSAGSLADRLPAEPRAAAPFADSGVSGPVGSPVADTAAVHHGLPAASRNGNGTAGDVSLRGTYAATSPIRALQIHDCYLVIETPNGLTVIDQHALHERVLYEQLRNRVLARSVEVQRLLIPIPIELSPREAGVLTEQSDVLAELGLIVQSFGGGTVALGGYPSMLSKADPGELLKQVAEQLESSSARLTRRDLIDSLLHMMACKAAVKAGQKLTPEEIDALLAQRDLVDDHHHCPHGRPTALTLSRMELDRQFGRLG